MSNHKEIKKLIDKYKEADYIILSEDHKNEILEFKSRLKGLKVPKQKITSPNFEEILFIMENKINSNIVNMENRINSNIFDMESRINVRIDEIKTDIIHMENRINFKIDNLKDEMNNRFDKLELRVSILEGFHQVDFVKN